MLDHFQVLAERPHRRRGDRPLDDDRGERRAVGVRDARRQIMSFVDYRELVLADSFQSPLSEELVVIADDYVRRLRSLLRREVRARSKPQAQSHRFLDVERVFQKPFRRLLDVPVQEEAGALRHAGRPAFAEGKAHVLPRDDVDAGEVPLPPDQPQRLDRHGVLRLPRGEEPELAPAGSELSSPRPARRPSLPSPIGAWASRCVPFARHALRVLEEQVLARPDGRMGEQVDGGLFGLRGGDGGARFHKAREAVGRGSSLAVEVA